MIWRSEDPDRNINVFVRPMFTPLQDRNLIDFSVNARPDDARTDPRPRRRHRRPRRGLRPGQQQRSGLDQDTAFYNPGVYSPVRHNETFFEATYQYQVMPWWQIQPDIQYVFNPGAGIVNPNDPDAEDQERAGDRPAHEHHVLRGGNRSMRRGNYADDSGASGRARRRWRRR